MRKCWVPFLVPLLVKCASDDSVKGYTQDKKTKLFHSRMPKTFKITRVQAVYSMLSMNRDQALCQRQVLM